MDRKSHMISEHQSSSESNQGITEVLKIRANKNIQLQHQIQKKIIKYKSITPQTFQREHNDLSQVYYMDRRSSDDEQLSFIESAENQPDEQTIKEEENNGKRNQMENMRGNNTMSQEQPPTNGKEKYNQTGSAYLCLIVRDLILHMVFAILVTAVALSTLGYSIYIYNIVLSDVLTETRFEIGSNGTTNFRELRTIEHLWKFILDIYLQVINCKHLNEDSKSLELSTEEAGHLKVFENIIIGVPRIRQVRVKPDSCHIPNDFRDVFKKCYDVYNPTSEDKEPFGAKIGSEWKFQENIAGSYRGKISIYGSGGYYMNFTRNCRYNDHELKSLRELNWIDDGTRAIFLDFTVYSPNVNLFFVSKLVAELPPSGGVITQSQFKSLKLLRYVNIWDYVILAFEMASLLLLLYYTVEAYRKCSLFRWQYAFYNILDFLIVGFGWCISGIGIWRFLVVQARIPEIVSTIHAANHGNFDDLVEIQEYFDVGMSIFVALLWVKLLKYLMISRTIYHILATLTNAAGELMGLLSILLTLLLSFSLIGHLLYGSQTEEFSTLGRSMVSLSLVVIGSLDYERILNIHPISGSIFFLAFIFCYILIFTNLLIAILVNGFATMRFEISEDKERIKVKQVFYKFLESLLNLFGWRDAARRIGDKVKEDEMKEDYQAVIDMLRRSGFRGRETSNVLEKHGIKEGKPILQETVQQLYNEIDTKEQLYLEAIEHEEIMTKVERLNVRMNYIDKMTEDVSTKVELLLENLLRSKK